MLIIIILYTFLNILTYSTNKHVTELKINFIQFGINIIKYKSFCYIDSYILKVKTNKNNNLFVNIVYKKINQCMFLYFNKF